MSVLTRQFENVPGKVLYRYVREVIKSITLFDISYPDVVLCLKTFPVTKETPKGKWIDTWSGPRWIANVGRKKFAYETEQEALMNLVKRSNKEAKILKYNLRVAEETARLAQQLYKDKNE